MPWFKVDDKLHDHRKSRKAGKAAMGVWVLAGSWSMDNETDGFVPDDVLSRWGTPADAAKLVSARLWHVDSHDGEEGWRFNDWSFYQPSAAVTAAKKAAEREAGLRGNHERWHVKRQVSDPDCDYCYQVPHRAPDQVPDGVGIGEGESGANRPVPEPDPVPISPNGENVGRADVEQVCQHLADKIASHGVKRPNITKRWRDAARLMLDNDGYTTSQAIWLIDRAHEDEFWQSNILSLPKLREKAAQLRIKFKPQAVARPAVGDDLSSREPGARAAARARLAAKQQEDQP